MKRCIISSTVFDQQWANIGLTDEDRCKLETLLEKEPAIGDIIPGTKGFRKVRFAIGNKGKSGSARIIYIDYSYCGRLYLATVYKKNQQDNLSQEQIKILNRMSDNLKEQLKRNGYM